MPVTLLWALWFGGPAQTDAVTPRFQDSLAIVPMVTTGPHGALRVDALYDAVLGTTRSRMGLRVLTWEEVYVARESGLEARVRACGSDSDCIASRLRTLDARMGLVVQLIFDLDPPVYRLQLLDTDSRKEIRQSVGRIPRGANVPGFIAQKTDDLLAESGYIESGRLVVEVNPPAANVQLREGVPADPGNPNIFTTAPGRYHVEASLEDYKPATKPALVKAGERTSVQLTLEDDRPIWKSVWFWSGIVAVVVAGVTTTAVLAGQTSESTVTLRQGSLGVYEGL